MIIILPNQLFENLDIFEKNPDEDVIIFEHPLYFTEFTYHKMKLVLHRASMKYYFDYLKKNIKNKITYLDFDEKITKYIKKKDKLIVFNPYDLDILKEYNSLKKKFNLDLIIYDNIGFKCTFAELKEYKDTSTLKNPYFHHAFYVWCRKKYNILLDSKDKPLGGRWSYDDENRLSFPKDFENKTKQNPDEDDFDFNGKNKKYIKSAIKYVETNFEDNHGQTELYLSITHEGAKKQFKQFLKERLDNFGPYEDAVSDKIKFGCHSVLSPLINIGLLTPKFIIEETEKYYLTNKTKIKIQSVEGYLRQIFWREFVAFVYLFENPTLEKSNHFDHKKKLTKDWYEGTTAFTFINDIINKCLNYGYAHHIERLMYLGNTLLLSEIKPKDTYKWFMEMFIDAYPWVMSPNVYGMSQHSAGPIMMKRPYFSSSNYIDKMSTYKKKKNINVIKLDEEYEWFEVLDALYYNFINNNSKEFSKNYSTANAVSVWNKKTKTDKDRLLNIAKKYLDKY